MIESPIKLVTGPEDWYKWADITLVATLVIKELHDMNTQTQKPDELVRNRITTYS